MVSSELGGKIKLGFMIWPWSEKEDQAAAVFLNVMRGRVYIELSIFPEPVHMKDVVFTSILEVLVSQGRSILSSMKQYLSVL